MSLSDIAALAGVISSIAVLVSLVYLALQVRHAANSQRSETQGSATARRLEVLIAQSTAEASLAMNMGMSANPDITPAQITQFISLCNLIMASAEDEFFQHRRGLLDEQRYTLQRGILQQTFMAPGFRAVWRMTRNVYHADFAAFVDGIMRETEPLGGDAFFQGFRMLAAEEHRAAVALPS
jgi:hypothetical protein